MHENFLGPFILTYAIAVVLVIALARVRVPSIVALMLAGIVAGPTGLRVISSREDVEMLAELGIVLLLFTVGLDFSTAAVQQIWRPILVGGVLQMAGTAVVIAALVLLLDIGSVPLAIFIGLFVALSSTAIVLKGLAERNQLSAPHGRLSVGILLLQDLAIVVLLLLVPILSGQTPVSAVPMALIRAVVAIGAVAGVSRIVLPPLMRIVTSSGRREAFTLVVGVASIGAAWLGTKFGLTMAIGAFLAGLMLAESEFSHQAYAEVRPVRDVLAGLFFISLGMLVDLDVIAARLPVVLAVAVAIVVLKAVVATAALVAAATPLRVAAASAIGLSQVGEFSFILGRAGLDAKLLPDEMSQVLLGASVATMLVTPALVGVAAGAGVWFSERITSLVEGTLLERTVGIRAASESMAAEAHDQGLSNHVIIFGFGAGGRLVARALRDLRISYIILELNGATVQEAKGEGERIIYGDATSPESLHAAGVERALAIVSLLSDPDAALRMVTLVREQSKSIALVVRTRYRLEAERLQAAGATVAVAEELEASLEVLAQLLARLDLAGNVIEPLIDVFRRESVSLRPVKVPRPSADALPRVLEHLPVSTHQVERSHWAEGRTMSDIDLRKKTGATVLAVQRNDKYVTPVPPDEKVVPGDVLYLVGDESDILLARRLLMSGD
jgi:CPA2 family monovalent cation:H+ antiporter-2